MSVSTAGSTLAAGLLSGLVLAAPAEAQDFSSVTTPFDVRIVNQSGSGITHLYAMPSEVADYAMYADYPVWVGYVPAYEETWATLYGHDGCHFHIMAVFDNGGSADSHNVSLCQSSYLTIGQNFIDAQ